MSCESLIKHDLECNNNNSNSNNNNNNTDSMSISMSMANSMDNEQTEQLLSPNNSNNNRGLVELTERHVGEKKESVGLSGGNGIIHV